MGVWGIKAFEDDASSDWVYDLEKSSGFAIIESTFSNWSGETDSDCECLGAAETVAASIGHAREDLPPEIVKWVKKAKRPSSELVSLAIQTARGILNDSELLELWKESDEADVWKSYVEDLITRLESPPSEESVGFFKKLFK